MDRRTEGSNQISIAEEQVSMFDTNSAHQLPLYQPPPVLEDDIPSKPPPTPRPKTIELRSFDNSPSNSPPPSQGQHEITGISKLLEAFRPQQCKESSSTHSKTSGDHTFKLPTLPASRYPISDREVGRSLDNITEKRERHERASTPAPLDYRNLDLRSVAEDDENSEDRVTSSRPSSPSLLSDASSSPGSPYEYVEVPSQLAFCSPSDTPKARIKRRKMPLFGNLDRHGTTTYGRIPEDRSIEVDDVSHIARNGRRGGVVEGSTNGHYLQERKDLQMLAEAILAVDYEEKKSHRPLFDVLKEIRDQRNSWPAMEAELQKLSSGNTSEWMNETWGGPVKDDRREIVSLTSPRFTRGTHKIDHGTQGALHKRRLKDRQKRFTPPVNWETRISSSRTSSDWDQQTTDNTVAPGNKRKLVLVPPKPKRVKKSDCHRCGEQEDKAEMFACLKCGQIAYCSDVCQQKYKDKCCMLLYEINKNTGLWLDDQKNAADTETSRLRPKPWNKSMLSDEKLSSSINPRNCESHSHGFKQGLKRKHKRFTLPASPEIERAHKEFSSAENSEVESTQQQALNTPPFKKISIQDLVSSPQHSGATVNDLDELFDIQGMSAEEIEEQKRALAQFARPIRPKPNDDAKEDWNVVNYEFRDKGRSVYYQVESQSGSRRRWASAIRLYAHGAPWPQKIARFWLIPENDDTLSWLQKPFGPNPSDPPPLGRFILSANLSDGEVVFNKRDHEVKDLDRADEDYWASSHDLEPEWDDVIADYWRRCSVGQKRAKPVEGVDELETMKHSGIPEAESERDSKKKEKGPPRREKW